MPASLLSHTLHLVGLSISVVLYVVLAYLAWYGAREDRRGGIVLLVVAAFGIVLSAVLGARHFMHANADSVGAELVTHYASLPLVAALLYVVHARRREDRARRLAAEAELRALHAQLNPHFLFNALTTIGYLIRASPERAVATLLKLTELLRAVLRQSSGELTTVQEEIALVEVYLAIEQARFEERLAVQVRVDAGLDTVKIPPLIIQTLVENAVKHGIAPSMSGGRVDIQVLDERGALRIRVRDNGVGCTAAALQHGQNRGVGLTNVERRLSHYYGSAASMTFESSPEHGTTAELSVPKRAS